MVENRLSVKVSFDNYDSQENSGLSVTHDHMDDETNFTKKAMCNFSTDTSEQIVNEVTLQKEAEIEQINNKIHAEQSSK
eukprot:5836691-Ditylum_brightwellii.AAC.1